jgi:hypothetical protein
LERSDGKCDAIPAGTTWATHGYQLLPALPCPMRHAVAGC